MVDEPAIGISRLRITVDHPLVGMGRGAVEVVVDFLAVLAVIPLGIGQAVEALF